jgi:general secretion pathway protein I
MPPTRPFAALLKTPDWPSQIRGFTLLEVLVALAVIAVALAALVGATTTQIKLTERIRENTIAGWVAANVLTELKLREPFPEPGTRTGVMSMANQRFAWRVEIKTTVESDLRRIDLRVSRKSEGAADAPILSRTEFAGRR